MGGACLLANAFNRENVDKATLRGVRSKAVSMSR